MTTRVSNCKMLPDIMGKNFSLAWLRVFCFARDSQKVSETLFASRATAQKHEIEEDSIKFLMKHSPTYGSHPLLRMTNLFKESFE